MPLRAEYPDYGMPNALPYVESLTLPTSGAQLASVNGWVVRGKRWDVEREMHEHFRSPPEPQAYTEEIAKLIHRELARVHKSWVWEIIPPNVKVSDGGGH
jgi:hypothetical protein